MLVWKSLTKGDRYYWHHIILCQFYLSPLVSVCYNKTITHVGIERSFMNNVPSISEAEYQVMKIVWANAPISTNGVTEKLVEISKWSPKTIQTLLSRLVKKGVLDYKKESRIFVYTPLVKEAEYLVQESNIFLNKFYNGTLNSMVVNFLKQDKLTKDNIDELRRILDESLEKEGKKHD